MKFDIRVPLRSLGKACPRLDQGSWEQGSVGSGGASSVSTDEASESVPTEKAACSIWIYQLRLPRLALKRRLMEMIGLAVTQPDR
jgi:hypothetical protein